MNSSAGGPSRCSLPPCGIGGAWKARTVPGDDVKLQISLGRARLLSFRDSPRSPSVSSSATASLATAASASESSSDSSPQRGPCMHRRNAP